MKKEEVIEELKKRGFRYKQLEDVKPGEYKFEDWFYYDCMAYNILIKDNITIKITAFPGVDNETGDLIPYQIILNNKIVVGNKRLLKCVDELLKEEER